MSLNEFFDAVKNGELQIVQNYIDQNPLIINELNVLDETALYIAALNGKKDIVSFLISKEAKLDVDGCESALMAAYLNGYKDPEELNPAELNLYTNIVIELINAGADLKVEDIMFGTLLMFECSKKNPNSHLIEKLIEKGGSDLINQKSEYNGETALMNACGEGHYDIVTKLIDGGADINIINNDVIENALMKACIKGHVSIVQKLLENGTQNINQKNHMGFTAYMITHISEEGEEEDNNKEKFKEIKTILIEKGADDNIQNINALIAANDALDAESEYDGRKKSKSVKRKKSKSVKRKKSKSVKRRKKSKSVKGRKKSKSVKGRKKSKPYL